MKIDKEDKLKILAMLFFAIAISFLFYTTLINIREIKQFRNITESMSYCCNYKPCPRGVIYDRELNQCVFKYCLNSPFYNKSGCYFKPNYNNMEMKT